MTYYAATWQALESASIGVPGIVRRRLVEADRRDIFLGVTVPELQRVLVLVVDADVRYLVDKRSSTAALSLTTAQNAEGRFEVRIILLDPSAIDIFDVFIEDVVEVASVAASETDSVRGLVSRFDRWKAIFSTASSSLSRETVQGLFGELWVMSNVLWPYLQSAVVAHWLGPDRELVDFQFSRLGLEVKTSSHVGPGTITIQNERQLDDRHFPQLFLAVVRLSVMSDGTGLTLNDLVAQISEIAAGQSALFSAKLKEVGYQVDDQENYDRYRFTVHSSDVYEVGRGFPRLVESALPAGISKVRYTLSTDACEPWKVSDAEFNETLEGLIGQ